MSSNSFYSSTTTTLATSSSSHTQTQTTTSHIHTTPTVILQSLLSTLPPLLTPPPSPQNTFQSTPTPTSTQLFWCATLQTHKTPSGKPVHRTVEFHLALSHQDRDDEACGPHDDPIDAVYSSAILPPVHGLLAGPCVIKFQHYTDAQMSQFESPQYKFVVNRIRKTMVLAHKHPPTPVSVSGTITLIPAAYDTTMLTLTTDIGIQPATIKQQHSGTGYNLGSLKPKKAQYAVGSVGSNFIGKLSNRVATMSTSSSNASTDPLPTAKLAATLLSHLHSLVPTLHKRHARYDEIDNHTFSAFETSIFTVPPASPAEEELITNSVSYDDQEAHEAQEVQEAQEAARNPNPSAPRKSGASLQSKKWSRIPHTVNELASYFQKRDNTAGSGSAWGKVIATVDASATRVFSYLFCLDTFQRSREVDNADKNYLRRVVTLPDSHSMLYVSLIHLVGVTDRVFASWFAWERTADGGFVLAFADMEQCPNKGAVAELNAVINQDRQASKAIRGGVRGFWRFVPRAKDVCEVTYTIQGKLGGIVPTVMMNSRVKTTLTTAQAAKDRFERGDSSVDQNLRDVFPSPPKFRTLDEPSQGCIRACKAFESLNSPIGTKQGSFSKALKTMKKGALAGRTEDDEPTPWIPFSSSSPFITMHTKASEEKGARQVSIARATTTIDCSALQTMAFLMEFCSRYRTRISLEEGNPARVCVSRRSPHDAVFATVKTLPLLFRNREFVIRQICAEDVNGDLIIAISDSDANADYGFNTSKLNLVRGETRALFRCIPVSSTLCTLKVYQYIDGKGNLPASLVNARIPLAVETSVDEARREFQRDGEVDEVERDEIARRISDEGQTYTAEEMSVIEGITEKLGNLATADFEHLESPDPFIQMDSALTDTGGVGRATCVIDASVELCAAWELAKMSRANLREYHEFDGIERGFRRLNDHSFILQVVYKVFPGFSPREWVVGYIWRWADAKTLIIVAADAPHADFPEGTRFIRTYNNISYEFTELPPVGGVPQTSITHSQRSELSGQIPRAVVRMGSRSTFLHIGMMRKEFDKSLQIDLANRNANICVFRTNTDPYTNAENAILRQGQTLFDKFDAGKTAKIELDSKLALAKIAFRDGDSYAWGWSSCTVRASSEQILAWVWDLKCRASRRTNDMEKSVEETPNGHNQLIYIKKKAPKGIDDRDFFFRVVWKKTADGFFVAASPSEGREDNDVVRAKFPFVIKLKKKNNNETIFQTVIKPDWGGSAPRFLTNRLLGATLSTSWEIQEYFQALRGLDEWDAQDGALTAEALVIARDGEKRVKAGESTMHARWRILSARHKGLRQIGEKYKFFPMMMTRVLQNKLRPVRVVTSNLCNVSEKEGWSMGRSLALSLASNLTAEAGVDEWILNYKPLMALDKKEVWFRPLMNVVSQRLLGEVSWGVKMRVFAGAGLSILDMATDISVVVTYWDSELHRIGLSLLAMILLSIVFQLTISVIQNMKKPSVMGSEVLIVLTGLKPAFDAFRVASGRDVEGYKTVSHLTELNACKGAEMFAESIPGCVIQCYAVLKSRDFSTMALVSILISALTTGFSCAIMSFDLDVSPEKRKLDPQFYGYIPNSAKRSLIFCLMLMNSALLLLIRSISAALLALVSKSYFVYYMSGDMALYLLWRLARNDLHSWLPVGGPTGIFVSVMYRIVVKTIADFTGVIHMRSPQEVGGFYWTFSMFSALIASLVSVWVYFNSDEGKGDDAFNEGKTWTLVGALTAGWMVCFALFLLVMKKEYRHTFFSLKTSKEATIERFSSDNEAIKAEIFKKNPKQWRAIRPKVKEWVAANWWRWNEEKPEWMTASWMGKVPEDFIPSEQLTGFRALLKTKRNSSRAATRAVQVNPVN